jgi:hypothetical protein
MTKGNILRSIDRIVTTLLSKPSGFFCIDFVRVALVFSLLPIILLYHAIKRAIF